MADDGLSAQMGALWTVQLQNATAAGMSREQITDMTLSVISVVLETTGNNLWPGPPLEGEREAASLFGELLTMIGGYIAANEIIEGTATESDGGLPAA